MLKSMTGFGRGSIDTPFGKLMIEIQSVNRKHFELSTSLPKDFFLFENTIRKKVREKVRRGHLSLHLHLSSSNTAFQFPDLNSLKRAKEGWKNIISNLELDPKELTLSLLIQSIPDEEKMDISDRVPFLYTCLEDAMEALLEMKQQEGSALSRELSERLKGIKQKVEIIETMIPDACDKMRDKLSEKMRSLFTSDQALEERLIKEIALFAEKMDITEEITRFYSHFDQFISCLNENDSVGRKMEFVLQEVSREINTIGSKSQSSKISQLVIEIKSELEKMREQVLNVE